MADTTISGSSTLMSKKRQYWAFILRVQKNSSDKINFFILNSLRLMIG